MLRATMAAFGGRGWLNYSEISPDDLVRVCLASGDEAAWAEFVRRFHPLIASVVTRVARQWGEISRQAIDDLVQETYLKLCANRLRLAENFRPEREGAIFGFIKVFTANLTHDHFKHARSQKRGGSLSISVDDDQSNLVGKKSVNADAELERQVLLQQIDACLKVIASGADSDRERRIFWLYYRVGLTASAIARLPTIELTTKGVESTIFRLSQEVRRRLSKVAGNGDLRQGSATGIRPADSL